MNSTLLTPTREQALQLLNQYVEIPGLKKHCLTVEAVMRHFARKHGENEEIWGIVGMLHDADYEKFPEQHCFKIAEWLEGWDPVYLRAIQSHGYGICTDVKPESTMEKTLYAIDELTGLVTACALVKPSKSFKEVELDSVMKKFKTPSFAAKVDRSHIQKGADLLGVDLRDLTGEVITALQNWEA